MKVLGKVALYKQKGSQNWYARFYINRVQFATSTKTPDLMEAEKVAIGPVLKFAFEQS